MGSSRDRDFSLNNFFPDDYHLALTIRLFHFCAFTDFFLLIFKLNCDSLVITLIFFLSEYNQNEALLPHQRMTPMINNCKPFRRTFKQTLWGLDFNNPYTLNFPIRS